MLFSLWTRTMLWKVIDVHKHVIMEKLPGFCHPTDCNRASFPWMRMMVLSPPASLCPTLNASEFWRGKLPPSCADPTPPPSWQMSKQLLSLKLFQYGQCMTIIAFEELKPEGARSNFRGAYFFPPLFQYLVQQILLSYAIRLIKRTPNAWPLCEKMRFVSQTPK